ncbi:hypothetical protein GOBAR_DD00629 [Gossypium barbadense]|nr:hypothetical protein GOBAR_DD00629 [Gossypium barbadense]
MVAHFVWTLDLLLPLLLLLLSPMPQTRPNRLEFKQMFGDAYGGHCTASTEGKRNKFCTDAIEAHLLTSLTKGPFKYGKYPDSLKLWMFHVLFSPVDTLKVTRDSVMLLTGDGESGPVTSNLPPEVQGPQTKPRRPSTDATTPPLFSPTTTCKPFSRAVWKYSKNERNTFRGSSTMAFIGILEHLLEFKPVWSGLGHWRQQQQKQWEKQIQGPNKVSYHFVYCSI